MFLDEFVEEVRQSMKLKDFDDSGHLTKLTKEGVDKIGVPA